MFDEHINKELLIVIEATAEFYPTLEKVKPKYGISFIPNWQADQLVGQTQPRS